jgi:hypothetical protein
MEPTRTILLPRALLAALCLLAAGLALAACGGSSSPSSDSGGSSDESALKFSKCMRENGVKNFPNPETSAGGATKLQFKVNKGEVSRQTMEAAQKACQHFQEEEAKEGPELSPRQKVEQEEAVEKFAKCMREHGIEVEAGTAGGGISVKIGRGGPNPESPAFRSAQEACQGMLPGPKGEGGAVRAAPGGDTQAGG